MATETLKSNSITNWDNQILPTSGFGGEGLLRSVNDHAAATTGVTAPSTYRLCRIPTNAKVKRVLLRNAALSTSTAADFDIAHSDSTTDGTPIPLQGTIPQISAADNKLFGAGLSLAAASSPVTEITFSGVFTTTHQNMELWNVLVSLGVTTFSADPGGFFDILVKTTTTVTAGGDISVEVDYVV